MRLRTLLIAALLAAAGCAPARESSLAEIVTVRSYKTTMEEMSTALRFFCEREGFLVRTEPSMFGKILASRLDQTLHEVDARKIILSVTYTNRDGLTQVNAHFGFANVDATLNRSDEHMLIDYYHRLFDYLEDTYPAAP